MFDDPRALQKVIEFLDEHRIPYMVIGGLAVSIWGEPRSTHDADFKVSIEMSLVEFRKIVLNRFQERPTNIPAHKKSAHVLQIWAMPNIATDLLVSLLDYEKEAIHRAVSMEIMGIPTRVCTAEDLIVHKMVAGRGKDWLDIQPILIRQRGKLDLAYIRNWLSQFAEALENPEILSRFDELYRTT